MIRVLLVTQGSSFIADSFVRGLEKKDIITSKASATIDDIRGNIGGIGLLLYLNYDNKNTENDKNLLEFIRNECITRRIILGIIGTEAVLNHVKTVIPFNDISFAMKLPVDMNDLSDKIKELSGDSDMRYQPGALTSDTVKHKLLLCDDDVMFLKMMRERLSGKYDITAVKSGMQAISYVSQHRPELLLLDYEMPVTSGPQVMEMLRSEDSTKDIPIVFLTGKSDRDSVLSVMRLKPQGYLLKSTKKEDIIAAIDNFFETGTWKVEG